MMLPKIGLTMKVHPSLNNVTWFGRGPLENYPDSKLSQRFDLYHRTIDELYTPYVVPQEMGTVLIFILSHFVTMMLSFPLQEINYLTSVVLLHR